MTAGSGSSRGLHCREGWGGGFRTRDVADRAAAGSGCGRRWRREQCVQSCVRFVRAERAGAWAFASWSGRPARSGHSDHLPAPLRTNRRRHPWCRPSRPRIRAGKFDGQQPRACRPGPCGVGSAGRLSGRRDWSAYANPQRNSSATGRSGAGGYGALTRRRGYESPPDAKLGRTAATAVAVTVAGAPAWSNAALAQSGECPACDAAPTASSSRGDDRWRLDQSLLWGRAIDRRGGPAALRLSPDR